MAPRCTIVSRQCLAPSTLHPAEGPRFYIETTYVHYVGATYENPQSAGLAVGQFVNVKTRVFHSTLDALIR